MTQTLPVPDVQPPQAPDTPRGTIEQTTVLLALKLGTLGNRRQVAAREVEVKATRYFTQPSDKDVDPDQDMVRVGKELLASPELDAIRKKHGEIRQWLRARALPSLLKAGVYRMPVALLTQSDVALLDYQRQAAALVDVFIKAYPRLVEEASAKLRDLFNPLDYPPETAIRSAFKFEWFYLATDVPEKLRELRNGIYEREAAKAAERIRAVEEATTQLLRQQFAELVDRMAEVLTVRQGEKPKAIRKTLLPSIREFLDLFSARNVVGDQELENLVDRARQLTEGLDPASLKDVEALRSRVAYGFADLKSKLSTMVDVKAPRAIRPAE